MIRYLFVMVAMMVAIPAFSAGPDENDPERVTGKKPPPLERQPDAKSASMDYKLPENMGYSEYKDRPYRNTAYIAAEMLKMDPEFVHGIQEGLELLYLRKYGEVRTHFEALEKTFPNTGVGAVADTLVWQALMLENFDFKYSKQYWVSTKSAREGLEAALKIPGNEAWEHFLMTGIVGMESIHTMRNSQYLQALQLAFSAMDHIGKAREAAPEWPDLMLADGMYNYWRTVVTMNSKILPDFGDKRVEGIEQMQLAENRGFFLSPPTTMALTFTWLEEGDYKRAITSCLVNRRKYPDNIINNMLTLQTYVTGRKMALAQDIADDVLRVDPKNRRVHYWRGLAYQRAGKPDLAKTSFEKYLAFGEDLEAWQKSYTHFRLGQVEQKKELYASAYGHFQAAVKIDGHKSAKRSMDRMKKQKKEGKISW